MGTEDQFEAAFDVAENAVDTVQETLDEIEFPEDFEDDQEHLEDLVETFEDALDDAQDGEDDARGRLPAYVDYIQQTASNLSAQMDGTAANQMQRVAGALEDVEDHIEGFDFGRNLWYVLVDDTPLLSEDVDPTAESIIDQARSDIDSDDYVLKAKASRFSDEVEGEFEGSQTLPLKQFFYYELERSTGGGRA